MPGLKRFAIIFLGGSLPSSEQNVWKNRKRPTWQTARAAVGAFFEVTRELKLLSKAEDDDRLPFGVAYFALLRAWIQGKIDTPLPEATVPEEARDLLASSLRTLGRTKKWSEALRTFLAKV